MAPKIVRFTDEDGRTCYAVAVPIEYTDDGKPRHWHECGLEQSLLGPMHGVEIIADFDRALIAQPSGAQ